MYWFGWLFKYLFGSGWDLNRIGNKNKFIRSKKINKIYIFLNSYFLQIPTSRLGRVGSCHAVMFSYLRCFWKVILTQILQIGSKWCTIFHRFKISWIHLENRIHISFKIIINQCLHVYASMLNIKKLGRSGYDILVRIFSG